MEKFDTLRLVIILLKTSFLLMKSSSSGNIRAVPSGSNFFPINVFVFEIVRVAFQCSLVVQVLLYSFLIAPSGPGNDYINHLGNYCYFQVLCQCYFLHQSAWNSALFSSKCAKNITMNSKIGATLDLLYTVIISNLCFIE